MSVADTPPQPEPNEAEDPDDPGKTEPSADPPILTGTRLGRKIYRSHRSVANLGLMALSCALFLVLWMLANLPEIDEATSDSLPIGLVTSLENTTHLGYISIATILILFVALAVATRRIARPLATEIVTPIAALTDKSRNIATGTITTDLPAKDEEEGDELDALTRCFNAMGITVGANQAWRDREQDLISAMMDNLPDNVYFKDTESRFLLVSKSLAKKFHLKDAASAVGKSDFDFFSNEHAQQAYDDEQMLLANKDKILDMEEKETWEDGHTTWALTTKMCLKDKEGTAVGTFGVTRDITEKKAAEDELRRVHREITAANERMKESLLAAASIQRSFLPDRLPDTDRAKFSWKYVPCDELAGDTMNIIPLDETRVGIYVADVSGHGVPAALLSVHLSRILTRRGGGDALLRKPRADGSYEITSPSTVAADLNQKFSYDPETQQYFTLLYGILDLISGEFRYTSAGHPGPIVVSGDKVEVHEATPPAIGFIPDGYFTESTLHLKKGDRLYLYTDGIFEVANESEEEFGEARVADALAASGSQPLNVGLDHIIREARAWMGGGAFPDDISLMALEMQ